jgi:hypothetical protein
MQFPWADDSAHIEYAFGAGEVELMEIAILPVKAKSSVQKATEPNWLPLT